MKLFLNNLLKGLLTAFVVICMGGFLSLKMSMSPTNMVLVSSSLVNSIKTESENDTSKEKKEEVKRETLEEKDQLEENHEKEKIEEKKEEPKDSSTTSNVSLNEESNLQNKEESQTNEETQKEEAKSNQDLNTNIEKKPETTEKTEEVVVQDAYAPNLEVLNTVSAIQTYYGKITAYGPDCYGCTTGKTASGRYVMEGNIYYQDKTYGNIRIVAADKSIPFGSIIKITGINISKDPILAIVLDRGGAIGFSEGKHAYFDLLYKSEKEALSFGRQTATFELLRQGY